MEMGPKFEYTLQTIQAVEWMKITDNENRRCLLIFVSIGL
jgi:hypothetical protein